MAHFINECLISISDKSSHGPAIVRVCQVEMICDANWKTIYNLFKLISSGYLLDCCKNTLSKKFHGSFYSCSFCSFHFKFYSCTQTCQIIQKKKKKSGMTAVVLKPFYFFFPQPISESSYIIILQLQLGTFYKLQTSHDSQSRQ